MMPAAIACALALQPASAAGGDAVLRRVLEGQPVPALAAGMVDAEGVVAHHAHGLRKAGRDVAVTKGDLWHLGSNTKAMTATLAATFVARRELTWESTVTEAFPGFAGRIHPQLRAITLADLLSHRAGLVGDLDWRKLNREPLMEARLEAAELLLTARPAGTPGDFRYSNAGYVVAGAMLEQAAGQPWERLMRQRVFTPLGMTSAGFGGTGTPGEIDQPWGHVADGTPAAGNGPTIDNAPILGPAGTIHATMDDWAKFLADQLRGAAGKPALLPTECYRVMHAPHPDGASHALGWAIAKREWAGGDALNHNGSNTMNFSVAWLAPNAGFAVFACSNQGGDHGRAATDKACAAFIQSRSHTSEEP